jgi:hypothetical protein
MTHKILTFDDLGIASVDVYEQMGYHGVCPDEMTQKETAHIMNKVREILRPEFCLMITRELPDFDMGKIILQQLKDAEAYALFIATSGKGFEIFLHQLKEEGDMVRVFIADALGSVIAEKCADMMEWYLQESIDKWGWKHTNRFSPGYCGWQVSEQQKLFPLFEGNTCGVTLTESSLMVPIKSVSGIIGVGQTVRRLDYTCRLCSFEKCYKRKLKLAE